MGSGHLETPQIWPQTNSDGSRPCTITQFLVVTVRAAPTSPRSNQGAWGAAGAQMGGPPLARSLQRRRLRREAATLLGPL